MFSFPFKLSSVHILEQCCQCGGFNVRPLLMQVTYSFDPGFKPFCTARRGILRQKTVGPFHFVMPSSKTPDSFLPASLVSSLLYFSFEVYAVARMMLILSSDSQMRKVIRDNRVVRPFALIFVSVLRNDVLIFFVNGLLA